MVLACRGVREARIETRVALGGTGFIFWEASLLRT